MKIEDGSCMVWTDEREIQKRKRGNESMCESTKLAAIALAQGMIAEMFVPCTSSSKWSPKQTEPGERLGNTVGGCK